MKSNLKEDCKSNLTVVSIMKTTGSGLDNCFINFGLGNCFINNENKGVV
jgi:hypothetical protein